MKYKYVMGLDSGTQSTRIIIFDSKGSEVCRGSAPHPPLISPQQGWMEHNKEDIWNAFCAASKDVMSKFNDDPGLIAGIGLSSQSTVIFPVDKEGNLLYNPISWMDGRAVPHPMEVPEDTPADWKSAVKNTKANWLKQVYPDIYEKVDKFLTGTGYITYMLTGQFKDSLAALVNNWPRDQANWAKEENDFAYECYGMTKNHVPELVLPCTLLGQVSKKAAEQTGLPEGLGVYAGGLDKECEFQGSGITTPNKAYITTGTCTTLARVSDRYIPGMWGTFGCIKGIYNYPVIVGKGFWIVSWFRDNLGKDLVPEAKAKGMSVEELLGEEASHIAPGSDGLIVIPEWQPIADHAYGKGMIIGFDDRHTRAHLYRALLEGIVMQMKYGYDLDKEIGVIDELQEIRVGGGGSRSPIVMQTIADVFGIRAIRASTTETCSLGASMCAAVGSGIYHDLHEAAKEMTMDTETFIPIPENQELFQQLYENVFQKVYGSMESILKELSHLTGDTEINFFV